MPRRILFLPVLLTVLCSALLSGCGEDRTIREAANAAAAATAEKFEEQLLPKLAVDGDAFRMNSALCKVADHPWWLDQSFTRPQKGVRLSKDEVSTKKTGKDHVRYCHGYLIDDEVANCECSTQSVTPPGGHVWDLEPFLRKR